jgi:hypothetical protein
VPGYLPAPPPRFESLGFNQLDLERVAALRPDLIVGNVPRMEEAYAELDPVAWWDGYSVSAGLACLDELDAALARVR